MKGLIVGSGKVENYEILEKVIKEVEFVLCADGGMDHLAKIKRLPNLVMGDLDSITGNSIDYIKKNNIPIERFSPIKDETDTFIAMDYLIKNGYKEITLMGVTGSRQDHTMANIFLLNTLNNKGVKGKIIDDNNTIFLVDGYLEMPSYEDKYISLIPITEDGIVLSLKGFFYNLDRKFISFGSTQCISNKVIEDMGIIHIHKGKALVFISKD